MYIVQMIRLKKKHDQYRFSFKTKNKSMNQFKHEFHCKIEANLQ
jgi:hypothetical protein